MAYIINNNSIKKDKLLSAKFLDDWYNLSNSQIDLIQMIKPN